MATSFGFPDTTTSATTGPGSTTGTDSCTAKRPSPICSRPPLTAWPRPDLPPDWQERVAETVPAPEPEPAKPVRKRRGYRISELAHLPEAHWLIESHFAKNSMGIIYGDSDSGKSFLALAMGLSLA